MAQKTDKTAEYYSAGLEIEETGHAFYQKTSRNSKNEMGKKLFGMLADDELVHMERIKSIYGSLKKGREWLLNWKKMPIKHPDIRQIFISLAEKNKDQIKPDSSDLEALDVGLDLENRSINYYEKHLKESTSDMEKEFLQQMVREEQTHHRLLSDMKFYLTNPESWYVEHEKHGLDGA
jgi:rubrerythrin